jgi:4-amino-4-deoxy-L-arabinose transferase-like glycosyltransferase
MGVASVLRDYTDYILLAVDDHWVTHNSGHPPLPLLFYTGLDEIGLGGSQASGLVTAAIGSTAVVAVLITVRVLGDERRARTAAPFLALSPLVIWIWISADGMFAAVVACGIAVLALAAVSPRPGRALALAVAAGLILGIGLFLSYGLVLMSPIAVAVLIAARQWRPLLPAALAALAVVGAFALAGFWWYEAQQILVTRYYEGKGADRPFSYWVWGNLAVAAIALGPAVWAAGGAAARQVRRDPRAALRGRSGALWLVAGAAAAVLSADLSMLSKSEVERIWLPFMVWLVLLTAQLRADDRRFWLVMQAAWALGICVVFRTTW